LIPVSDVVSSRASSRKTSAFSLLHQLDSPIDIDRLFSMHQSGNYMPSGCLSQSGYP